MYALRSICIDLYRFVSIVAIGFVTLKLFDHWHSGGAKAKGRAVDASIGAAAGKLEKTAIALDVLSHSGAAENLGRGLDEILTDTKNTIDTASRLVKRSIKQ